MQFHYPAEVKCTYNTNLDNGHYSTDFVAVAWGANVRRLQF